VDFEKVKLEFTAKFSEEKLKEFEEQNSTIIEN
jgi:hypothetical protein